MTMWAVLSCKIDSARHIFVFNKLHRLPSFDIDKHASQETAENNRNKVDLFYHLSLKSSVRNKTCIATCPGAT